MNRRDFINNLRWPHGVVIHDEKIARWLCGNPIESKVDAAMVVAAPSVFLAWKHVPDDNILKERVS